MHGRHFLYLDLISYNPEIEYSLRKIRAKKKESKKEMAKEQIPPPNNLRSISLPPHMTHLQEHACPLLRCHLRLNILLSKC